MIDEDITQLSQMLERRVQLAWAHEGTFDRITSIHLVDDEAKGMFNDGRYVDLYNVEPENVILFSPFVPYSQPARSPIEIAESWYDTEGMTKAIQSAGDGGFGDQGPIPQNVKSKEFAEWMTYQYRLAMAKGIQLGRNCSED